MFVIVDVKTGAVYKSYNTLRGAKRACSMLNDSIGFAGDGVPDKWKVVSLSEVLFQTLNT
jgi:hypothetical protein